MLQFIVRGNISNPPKEFRQLNDHYIANYEALSREQRQYLKAEYPQGYFRLQIWERGGADFDKGEAQLVCGADGEKLKPVKIRRKGWLANDRHALFVANELFVVNVKQEKRKIEYVLRKYSVKAKIGLIEEEILWTGSKDELNELPEELEKFKEVLEAATKKVLEYRCVYAMYYEKGE